MGSTVKTFLIVSAVLTVFLAYVYYEPLPQGAEFPNEVRKLSFGVRTAEFMADVAYTLGFSWGPPFRVVLGNYLNFLEKMTAPPLEDDGRIKVTNTEFNDVKVRLYDPVTTAQNRAGIIYIHGGGFLAMDIDHYDRALRNLAEKTAIFIVSIDYRRSDAKNPYPTSFDDCKVASTFFLQNSKKFRVDPSRIAIGGDSAGGNLATAVNLQLLEIMGLNKPKLQLLIYPILQAFDFNTPSYQKMTRRGILSAKLAMKIAAHYADPSMKYLKYFNAENQHVSARAKTSKYAQYVSRDLLPERFNKNAKPFSTKEGNKEVIKALESTVLEPTFSPLLADNLKGLPNTFMLTCEHDPLRDDGFMYAARLKKAGVPVVHVHLENLFHGLMFIHPKALEELITYLRKTL